MSDNNIYSIDAWTPNTTYFRNKIVSNSNLFYYATNNYTSDASSITNDINAGNLGGYIWYNGQQKPYFLWQHSYKASNKNTPKVKTIQFGDSYFQKTRDGINSLLLDYTLTYENRSLQEITAILHFLSTRAGVESFVFLPPAPRGNLVTMICPEWSDVQNFYSNYTIQANFIQSPV